MREIKGLPIGDGFPCFIIAEIGQNHQGEIDIAKELIILAKECGANCVKFQKSSLSDKFTQNALNAPYDSINAFGPTYGEHKSKLEFSDEQYKELQHFAQNEVGIMFTASAMDTVSADFLLTLSVPFIKIGSGDTNNFPLIDHIAKSKIPIVLSTGMQEFETVKEAVGIIQRHHANFAILHCISAYPTPYEDVNLSILNLYKEEFPNTVVGYSGHELGILVPMVAVACGAKVIEKHFTKDKSLKGTDHKCSLDGPEFNSMVDGIRQVERALGLPIKKILPSEIPCQSKLGKSIVSSRKIAKGSILTMEDLCVKVSQPHGISPQNIYKIVGRRINKTIEADIPVMNQDLVPCE